MEFTSIIEAIAPCHGFNADCLVSMINIGKVNDDAP